MYIVLFPLMIGNGMYRIYSKTGNLIGTIDSLDAIGDYQLAAYAYQGGKLVWQREQEAA